MRRFMIFWIIQWLLPSLMMNFRGCDFFARFCVADIFEYFSFASFLACVILSYSFKNSS